MSTIISLNKISKSMGSRTLFEELSFGVGPRERLGLLGPNGAGKSTLLRLIAGEDQPEDGDIFRSKGLKTSFVRQEESYRPGMGVLETAQERLHQDGVDSLEAEVQAPIHLSMAGFKDLQQNVEELSGGWLKRLSLAIALAKDPDLLILDEPTNHMDWEGILWLEDVLRGFKGSLILVSHDRAFLNNICSRTMEINSLYRDGFLAFDAGYDGFLKKREEYIEAQLKLQESLSNKARREVEWLRAGVKARTTKSQSRIKEAHELLDTLAGVKARNQAAQAKVRVEIDSTSRLSKKLVEFNEFNLAYEDRHLIDGLNLTLGPKMCLGILGDNGAGKTSLLRALADDTGKHEGEIFKAQGLRVMYFDQKRESLPQDEDLLTFLGEGSDHVVFKGKSHHVSAYARRFLFSPDKMKLKISQFSGGEQARLLMAKQLLQPADVLILDEPTNDLDIQSIEVLEESLKSFDGLVLLVSHDRFFLTELCKKYLALDGKGGWALYSDLNQWLKARKKTDGSTGDEDKPDQISPPRDAKEKPKPVRLSYKEKRQWETIEEDIARAERELEEAQRRLEDPEVFSDHEKTQIALEQLSAKKQLVDQLYKAWSEIDEKLKALQ